VSDGHLPDHQQAEGGRRRACPVIEEHREPVGRDARAVVLNVDYQLARGRIQSDVHRNRPARHRLRTVPHVAKRIPDERGDRPGDLAAIEQDGRGHVVIDPNPETDVERFGLPAESLEAPAQKVADVGRRTPQRDGVGDRWHRHRQQMRCRIIIIFLPLVVRIGPERWSCDAPNVRDVHDRRAAAP
jgi:hypothetical protein